MRCERRKKDSRPTGEGIGSRKQARTSERRPGRRCRRCKTTQTTQTAQKKRREEKERTLSTTKISTVGSMHQSARNQRILTLLTSCSSRDRFRRTCPTNITISPSGFGISPHTAGRIPGFLLPNNTEYWIEQVHTVLGLPIDTRYRPKTVN